MDPLAELHAVIGEDARLERPPQADFGDYSTNAAMLRAPTAGKPPREVAAALAEELKETLGDDVERIDVAGPGFLNLSMTERWFRRAVAEASAEGGDFGRGSGGERVLVEFVSANPTGPMTVASARGAAIGDSLARLL
jgi:arginyl-tRNA synthetase